VGKLLAREGLDGFLALAGSLDQAELPPEAPRGVRQDHAVVDGRVEHGSERGVDDADRVPHEARDELLGEERLDASPVELANLRRTEGGIRWSRNVSL